MITFGWEDVVLEFTKTILFLKGERVERGARDVRDQVALGDVDHVADHVAQAVVELTPAELLPHVLERDTPFSHAKSSRVFRELGFGPVEHEEAAHEHRKRPAGAVGPLGPEHPGTLFVLRFLGEAPPVLCDWLPWNHTAGGNHDVGLVLYNGGSYYIDEGKPMPGAIEATVRNLREVPCTGHFTVPRFYEMLMPHLRSDAALRATFAVSASLSTDASLAWPARELINTVTSRVNQCLY
mgnify:CR=1 FL=1